MIVKHRRFVLLVVSFFFAGAARAIEVDFSHDSVDVLFDDSSKALLEISDGLVTLPAQIETRAFSIETGKKYKLEITAKVAGDFVEELNERAHILTVQSFRNRLTSTYERVFLDANGEEIPGLGGTGPGAAASQRGFFLTQRQQPYVAAFYPPAKAVALKVRFLSESQTTQIARLELDEETDEGTVNPNPDFRYGQLNYSGWQPQRDGRLYTRPDGKTVLNVGYGGTSPFFPLSPETKYRVSAIGESAGGKGTVSIQYFDQQGTSIRSSFLFRPALQGVETELTPPPGTALARIVMYGGVILEEFKVTPVNSG